MQNQHHVFLTTSGWVVTRFALHHHVERCQLATANYQHLNPLKCKLFWAIYSYPSYNILIYIYLYNIIYIYIYHLGLKYWKTSIATCPWPDTFSWWQTKPISPVQICAHLAEFVQGSRDQVCKRRPWWLGSLFPPKVPTQLWTSRHPCPRVKGKLGKQYIISIITINI